MKSKNETKAHLASPDADDVAMASNFQTADEQAIRELAYAIYEARGEANWNPVVDWLEAEQQLKKNDAPVGREPRV